MPTKPVTYRLEESLLQRIEKAVEVLKAENPYGTISKNSVVAGILEEGIQKILKEATSMQVTLNDQKVDFDVAVNLMDDELREQVHAELAPCTNQEFLDRYVELHREKYGEEFTVD